MSHALVVGGTGMLRPVSIFLTGQYEKVSVLGLSDRVDSLAKDYERINPIYADYRNVSDLTVKLETAVRQYGAIELAVVWIHSDAQNSWYDVGERIGSAKNPGRYVHILGSGNADPSNQSAQEARRRRFESMPNIGTYQEVFLGWQKERDANRWLTRDEISNGVLYAIRSMATRYVVGNVAPWSERPSR